MHRNPLLVLCKKLQRQKWGIVLAVIFGLVGTVAWWYYIKDIMKYILEHAANEVGAIGSVVYEYRHNGAVVACQVLIALTLQALTVLSVRPLKAETLKNSFGGLLRLLRRAFWQIFSL